ncbi:MAG: hypothetical protein ABJC04_00700 [Verrucomicrobiota bacterium]
MKSLLSLLILTSLFISSGWTESLPEIDNQPHFPTSGKRLLPFNEKTTLGAYRKVGSHNPKWDKDAETALSIYARFLTGQEAVFGTTNMTKMVNCFSNAVAHGCDDPLIQYAAVRLRQHGIVLHNTEELGVYKSVLAGLEKHCYPANRQCLMYERALECLLKKIPLNDEQNALGKTWMETAMSQLPFWVNDDVDRNGIYETAGCILQNYLGVGGDRKEGYDLLHAYMEKIVTNKTVVPRVIAASYYREWGWQARGSGYSDSVTETKAKLFEERLTKAKEILEEAWKQDQTDPFICKQLMDIAGSIGSPDEMDLWFRRGKKVDPAYYALYLCQLHYLHPQWYGSEEEMINFGRKCLTEGNWNGLIPFILIAVHDEGENSRFGYLRKPEVWKDVEEVYETYLKKYPKNNMQKSAYCFHAVKAEKWDLAKRLMDELGEFTVYHAFEGKVAFCRAEIQKHIPTKN